MNRVAETSRAIFGNRHRLELLAAIATFGRPFYARELAERLGVADNLVGPQLRRLHEAGLLDKRTDGGVTRYEPSATGLWRLASELVAELRDSSPAASDETTCREPSQVDPHTRSTVLEAWRNPGAKTIRSEEAAEPEPAATSMTDEQLAEAPGGAPVASALIGALGLEPAPCAWPAEPSSGASLAVTDRAVSWALEVLADANELNPGFREGTRLSQPRLRTELSKAVTALAHQLASPHPLDAPLMISALAREADVRPKHMRILLEQPLELAAMATYEWMVRSGRRRPAVALRLLVLTKPSTVRSTPGLTAIGRTHVLTMIGLAAEAQGSSIPIAWLPLSTPAAEMRAEPTSRDSPRERVVASTLSMHVHALLSRVDRFREALAERGPSQALPSDLPLVGGPRPISIRPSRDATWTADPATAAEVACLLDHLEAQQQLAVLPLTSTDTVDYETADGRYIRAVGLADLPKLLTGATDFVWLVPSASTPAGPAYMRSLGGVIVEGAKRRVLIRTTDDVVDLLLSNARNDQDVRHLVPSIEAVYGTESAMARRQWTAACDAPFSIRATSPAMRHGMTHLVALANLLVVSAAPRAEAAPDG